MTDYEYLNGLTYLPSRNHVGSIMKINLNPIKTFLS
jgi:hypothetical protein